MLDPIKFFCNCALPAVYDDSLSYYEVITKLAYKLNDMVTEINSMFKEVANSLTGSDTDLTYSKEINVVTYDESTQKFSASESRITDLETATFNLSVDLEEIVNGVNNNTDLNEIEHNTLSSRISTAEDGVAQVEQNIVTLNKSISPIRDGVYSANSVNCSKDGYLVTTLTSKTSTVVDNDSIVNGSIKTLADQHNSWVTHSQIEEITIDNRFESLEDGQSDLYSEVKRFGWNNAGKGAIMIYIPYDNQKVITVDSVKAYFAAKGYSIETVYIGSFYPSAGETLAQQITKYAGTLTEVQRDAIGTVYAMGNGNQNPDNSTVISAMKALFKEWTTFVFLPDGGFNPPSKDYTLSYEGTGVNVVYNSWEYLTGTDINTTQVPTVVNQSPWIFMDLLTSGTSNRATTIKYWGGGESSQTNPGWTLVKTGRTHKLTYHGSSYASDSDTPFNKGSDAFVYTTNMWFGKGTAVYSDSPNNGVVSLYFYDDSTISTPHSISTIGSYPIGDVTVEIPLLKEPEG